MLTAGGSTASAWYDCQCSWADLATTMAAYCLTASGGKGQGDRALYSRFFPRDLVQSVLNFEVGTNIQVLPYSSANRWCWRHASNVLPEVRPSLFSLTSPSKVFWSRNWMELANARPILERHTIAAHGIKDPKLRDNNTFLQDPSHFGWPASPIAKSTLKLFFQESCKSRRPLWGRSSDTRPIRKSSELLRCRDAYPRAAAVCDPDRGCDRAFGQLRGLWHLGGYMPPRSLCARRHKGSAKGKDGMEIFLARPIFNTNAHGQKHIGIEHKTICSVSGQFDVPWLREQGQGVTQELWANQRKADVKITVRRQQNQAGWGGLAPGSMTHCSGLGKIQNRCSCAPCWDRKAFLGLTHGFSAGHGEKARKDAALQGGRGMPGLAASFTACQAHRCMANLLSCARNGQHPHLCTPTGLLEL